MRDQFRAFEDDKGVVECVALVGFGKVAGDYAGIPFNFRVDAG
jgi:hypothetical protein